jgi:hypothetical protein
MSCIEVSCYVRETTVDQSPTSQPQSAESPDQATQQPFGRRIIAVVVVPIAVALIAAIFVSLTHGEGSTTTVNYPAMNSSYNGSWTNTTANEHGTLTVSNLVQDSSNGTFRGEMVASLTSSGCFGGTCYCLGTINGKVTTSQTISFTYAPYSNGPDICSKFNQSFSGVIEYSGEIQGMYSVPSGVQGAFRLS